MRCRFSLLISRCTDCILLAPSQYLPGQLEVVGRHGQWYIQVTQGLYKGYIKEAMYYEKFQ